MTITDVDLQAAIAVPDPYLRFEVTLSTGRVVMWWPAVVKRDGSHEIVSPVSFFDGYLQLAAYTQTHKVLRIGDPREVNGIDDLEYINAAQIVSFRRAR